MDEGDNCQMTSLSFCLPTVAAAFLKHPRTPTGMTGIDYQSADSEHLMKRMRTDEVSFSGPNVYSQDDLPKTVVRSLNQGYNVMSMDFHPQQQTILLVGTNVGDISLWEVGSREKLAHKPFELWDLSTSSMPLQTALLNDAAISVNRCVWGPDGLMLGVAFSKHIVQIYTYNPSGELRQHLEIDAHIGGVNDIAFAHPNKQLCIVTCGDDKMIKVWDAVAGRRQYTFEGHEAPVYSVCPHYKESIQFIFSTAIDGKIKAWLYDSLGSRVDYDAPGLWCTMMAYSADGTRLFSCGTSKEGESHLVEWNESEGTINRTFSGFRKRSSGVVQFDTTRSRFLAAGDEFQIKLWDMDNTNMLTAVDAEGGLPASPRLRFNKEGSLLAATTSDNGIKILANNDGIRLIRMLENRAIDKNRSPSEPINSKPLTLGPMGNVPSGAAPAMERSDRIPPAVSIGSLGTMDNNRHVDVKPRILDELDKSKSWSSPDIVDSSQLKALRLPDPMATGKVIDSIAVESSAKKKMGRKRKKSERASIHPKNKYADKAPDFGLLASLYASFKPFVFYSSDGRPKIDWTDFNSTRELTRVLLLHDHGLNWWIPDGQLCPTVPNRSNYIHWIEDLLSSNVIPEKKGHGKIVRGFDIGTGANCIYPLLGASLLGWSFVGSDVTDVALEWAERNVKNNPHISELMEVRKVVNCQGALSIEDVHNAQSVNGESKTDVNECLIMEQLNSSNKYDGPHVLFGVVKDACGGTPEEMVCPGGEKAFITRIIEDSAVLKESFRWYTSMVGRKANLKFLTSKLRKVGVTIVKTTEFVQGRTCRWGLAWSFLPPIKKITSPHVAAKSIISFMLEGMQRQHSAIDVLKSIEFYFFSMGASSKLNASSFVVDITMSNEQCDALLKNEEKHYDESTNCNSVEGNFASSSCSHLPRSDVMSFRISVFQQIPGTLLVKGSLQQRDSTVTGMFPLVIQLLEETLTLKFCRVKNV
ncbi:Ribosomal RNA large subunit methyltransferase F [Euphorbia peplus]|nr:Ribosomal RNA large subunit methyltransferase F [Euphorbia peplus]